MDQLSQFIAQGHGWLFFPMAVFLGALHGLEPGHSKTMMTAFIVGIRGTVWQAFPLWGCIILPV
jgi:nickel/cobalt exporter